MDLRLGASNISAMAFSNGQHVFLPSFWGTAEYAAPEVIDNGSEAFSPSSDFWSLGIFLYEMMYGRTPFRCPVLPQALQTSPAMLLLARSMDFCSSSSQRVIDRRLQQVHDGVISLCCRGHSMEQTFYQIRMRGVQFPGDEKSAQISHDMQQLLRGLLRQRQEYRIGSSGGADEIRAHRALRSNVDGHESLPVC